ncbi:hypothetical protein HBI13_020540 [Parastagonospora nodorum]|nr:hypothetical protein HBI10_097900 [Parastagonospora nodorum]KAH4032136.1 hypothetical protein HBI13_020540 [Parastagonospora nodorum]KAH4801093.1 hypothetical protein HBH61_202040 [Parastagonospora nodorum]KAH4940151.1 hypothetical protein HBI79_039620 [Parastagonospora nodorum]KAH5208332.1 hypothetical protein HBH68_084140 [Parastagonospora nodorum]
MHGNPSNPHAQPHPVEQRHHAGFLSLLSTRQVRLLLTCSSNHISNQSHRPGTWSHDSVRPTSTSPMQRGS